MRASEKAVDVTTLRNAHFSAWKVPADEDFAQLIAVAALSFQPGHGLTGGDTSTQVGVVNTGDVQPLLVEAGPGSGMVATGEGLALQLAATGGLTLAAGKVGLTPSHDASVRSDGGICVQAVAPLTVTDKVALDIDTACGLRWGTDNPALTLNLDTKTMDNNGTLRVKCQENGGLRIDESGYLTVDIAAILARS
ncbi:hypothetical protein KH388_22235 [Serratia rubidaea]|nr:hypothetical protein [Serratia rubidaea]